MGNCALKPKVLSETGAPAPEELKDSLLEYHKIDDTAKSLCNLFLQDKAERKTKDDEKMTPENMPVAKDLKTALAEEKTPTKEAKSPAIETTSPKTETKAPADEKITPEKTPEDKQTVLEETKPQEVTETKSLVTETKASVDDQKAKNEEAVCEEKVTDVVTVNETEEVGEKQQPSETALKCYFLYS